MKNINGIKLPNPSSFLANKYNVWVCAFALNLERGKKLWNRFWILMCSALVLLKGVTIFIFYFCRKVIPGETILLVQAHQWEMSWSYIQLSNNYILFFALPKNNIFSNENTITCSKVVHRRTYLINITISRNLGISFILTM